MSLITRGLSSLQRLVTRGLGGVYVPPQPPSKQTGARRKTQDHRFLVKYYDLVGKKGFKLYKAYPLDGIISFLLNIHKKVIGRAQFQFINTNEIKGTLSTRLNNTYNLTAITKHSYVKTNTIEGIKSFLYNNELDVISKKQYVLNYEFRVHASLKHALNINKNIVGNKKIKYIKQIDLKGRKDISNILMSVGLFKGE